MNKNTSHEGFWEFLQAKILHNFVRGKFVCVHERKRTLEVLQILKFFGPILPVFLSSERVIAMRLAGIIGMNPND